jgi:Spy/CpxP family protein refolding chaperone
MTPYLAGAAGALAALFTVHLLRRLVWMRRLHRSGRRAMPLRFLYRRLGTRPEQEQVISAEADALASELHELRTALRSVRDELADLVAAPAVDAEAVQAAIDGRLERISALRTKLAAALARIHATLEPAQRQTLAALIRNGAHGRRCGHGHAHAHGHC